MTKTTNRMGLILIIIALVATGSQSADRTLRRFEYTEIHMGVETRIVLFATDDVAARLAARAAFDRIVVLDAVMSDYRSDSELMRVCASGSTGRRPVTPDLHRVLGRAREIAEATDGAFDVTVGPLVRLWRQARRDNRLPDAEAIAWAMDRVGHQYLIVEDDTAIELTRPGMLLDLGGIGKGFAADEALAVLAAAGHAQSLVDVGGDIAVGDPPPGADGWRVALSTGTPRSVSLANRGVATSGDREQFVEIAGTRYSHIVDPGTGLGLTERPIVTVIAQDAATADALASAVSVRGRALIDRFEDASVLMNEPRSTPVKKVLVIGIDGFRPDALPAARTPNLDRLIASGCVSTEALTGEITVSGPGWSSMLTGVWMDKHNVRDNSFEGARLDRYPHFFARLKQRRPDAVTASIVDWIPIDEFILGATGADIRIVRDYENDGDTDMTAAAVETLSIHDPDAMFLYFADLDVAGHEHGFHPDVEHYTAELEQIDGQVGMVLRALHGRATYADEDWLVIVCTDHGGTIDGGHGRDVPLHRTIGLIVSGPSAARGRLHTTANIVDVAATALAHLEVEIDPAWNLDGRPVGLRTPTRFGVNLIFNGDAEYGRGREQADDDAGIGGWNDTSTMTVIRYGAIEGFPDRDSPGPPNRGDNFFCGGVAGESGIEQIIDIADLAPAVDAGLVSWELSGWFGGLATQRDLASLTATFLDGRGGALGCTTIGPVTLTDRDAMTGLWFRSAHGVLPAQTRRIVVRLFAETGSGDNDGYADELGMELKKAMSREPFAEDVQ